MSVTDLPKTEEPIAEIEPIRRLGESIRRGRNKKEMSVEDLAGKMGVSPVYLVEVERGTSVVDAKQCHEISDLLDIDVELLLSACSDWHKAAWNAAKDKPGFQLVEQASQMAGVRGTDPELEKIATELLYTSVDTANAMLRKGHHLMQASNRLQAVLIARGVLLPNPPERDDIPPSDDPENDPQAGEELGKPEHEA
jgi:transcriptional regulator with XRE-family HTH domain